MRECCIGDGRNINKKHASHSGLRVDKLAGSVALCVTFGQLFHGRFQCSGNPQSTVNLHRAELPDTPFQLADPLERDTRSIGELLLGQAEEVSALTDGVSWFRQ